MQVSRTSTIAAPSAAATVTRSTRHRFLARPAAWVTAHPLVALATIVLGSFVVRLAAAFAYATPRYFQDEYVYAALARSIAHGHVTIRGGSASFPALVDPLLTSVAWLQNDPEVAYRITQGIHALAISLAAVPVYLLGRRLALPLRDTLLAAAATVALPSFVFSAYVTADALGVTLALCAVLAGVVALERPTARTQSVFLVLAVVATLTRIQYVFLPAAFIVAALVVERGNLRSAARAFMPTLIVLAVLTTLTLLAGPHRLIGLYDGIFEFNIDLTDIGRWVVVNTFLLALATGAVVLPGAIGGLVGALGRRAGRAERGFATFAIVSLLALLLEAAIFSANGTHGFFERYLMLAGPAAHPWALPRGPQCTRPDLRNGSRRRVARRGDAASALGLCGRGRQARLTAPRRRLLARGPARHRSGIAACRILRSRPDPLLDRSPQGLEGRRADLPRDRDRRRGRGVVCGSVLRRGACARRPHDVPAGRPELGRRRPPRPRHDAARRRRQSPGRLDPSLLEHHARARRAARGRRADRLLRDRQGHDRRRRNGGRSTASPSPGRSSSRSTERRLSSSTPGSIARTAGTSLWVPASQARIASLTEGLYLDGWLSYPSRIRVWPSGRGGTETMRFTLSLPANAPTQTVEVKGAGVQRSIVVPAGGEAVVSLDVDRSRLTELRITCKTALQVGGNRVVCAQATVPVLTTPNSVSS